MSLSDLDSFEDALGQFLIYFVALEEKDPERVLFLAVPIGFYNRFFSDTFFIRLAERFSIRLLVYDETQKNIVLWKR